MKGMISEQLTLGRMEILTDAEYIDESNLLEELDRALVPHRVNRSNIQYLWNYYRGFQDIQYKEKLVRPEINHKVTVNKASQIVKFKEDFVIGEPITYVTRSGEESVMKEVNKLNDAFFELGKFPHDKKLILWGLVCGLAHRYISTEKKGDIPFKIYTLDPRDSFVVKSSDIKREPRFAVSFHTKVGAVEGLPVVGVNIYQSEIYEVWTKDFMYVVDDGKIVSRTPNTLGEIPIIEYPANEERQGAFEIVLPLLNALNDVYSGRLDGLDNFVQAFLLFTNCDIDEEGLNLLNQYGALKIKSDKELPAKVEFINSELNQQQTQTLASDIEMQIITICGLPNRNGGLSTSDTGRATELRDGWNDALCRAKATEDAYKEADQRAMHLILKICSAAGYCKLDEADIQAEFSMHNYDNIQSKSQVLIAMLQNNKIHPKLAFEASGLFIDPESAYTMSMEFYEEEKRKLEEQMATTANADNNSGERTPSNTDGKPMSNPILKASDKQNESSEKN